MGIKAEEERFAAQSLGGRHPPGGTMICLKVANTPTNLSSTTIFLKMKFSGAAPGSHLESKWGKTWIGDAADEQNRTSWFSPDWRTPAWTWKSAQPKLSSQILAYKKRWEKKVTKEC